MLPPDFDDSETDEEKRRKQSPALTEPHPSLIETKEHRLGLKSAMPDVQPHPDETDVFSLKYSAAPTDVPGKRTAVPGQKLKALSFWTSRTGGIIAWTLVIAALVGTFGFALNKGINVWSHVEVGNRFAVKYCYYLGVKGVTRAPISMSGQLTGAENYSCPLLETPAN